MYSYDLFCSPFREDYFTPTRLSFVPSYLRPFLLLFLYNTPARDKTRHGQDVRIHSETVDLVSKSPPGSSHTPQPRLSRKGISSELPHWNLLGVTLLPPNVEVHPHTVSRSPFLTGESKEIECEVGQPSVLGVTIIPDFLRLGLNIKNLQGLTIVGLLVRLRLHSC